MKNVFLFAITIIMITVFSGCATVQGDYKKEYISKNLNPYLSKVKAENATVIFSNKSSEKGPDGYRGSAIKINMQTGQSITNIQKEFLSEYFANVNVSNKIADKGLTLESEVLDYNYHYMALSDAAEMNIKIKVTFYKDGVKKFTKIYESTDNNRVFLRFNNILPSYSTIELFNKQILKMFENDVKKDMLAHL